MVLKKNLRLQHKKKALCTEPTRGNEENEWHAKKLKTSSQKPGWSREGSCRINDKLRGKK